MKNRDEPKISDAPKYRSITNLTKTPSTQKFDIRAITSSSSNAFYILHCHYENSQLPD